MSELRTNITLFLTVTLVLYLILELSSLAILKSRPYHINNILIGDKWNMSNIYPSIEDNFLGLKLKPKSKTSAYIYAPDGTKVYDVTYSVDSFGRRTTNQKDLVKNTQKPNHNLFLFGDSTVFSIGLADSDSLSYHLQTQLPNTEVHNYAVFGYGPHHMLQLLRSKELKSEVEHADLPGVAIYTLLDKHIDRARGSLQTTWSEVTPCFILSKEGKLQHKGNLKECRPWRMYIYKFFTKLRSHSHFIELINFEYPIRPSNEDLKFLAALIKESHDLLKKQNIQLYLTYHPLYSAPDSPFNLKLKKELKNYGIKIIKSHEPPGDSSNYRIKHEGHPNGKFNKFFSKLIAKALQKFEGLK